MSSHTSSAPPTANKLDEFRRKKGWTLAILAEQLGVAVQSASRYCLSLDDEDYRCPNPEVAAKLPAITNGSVHVGMMLPAPGRAVRRAARRQAGANLTPRSHKIIPPTERRP